MGRSPARSGHRRHGGAFRGRRIFNVHSRGFAGGPAGDRGDQERIEAGAAERANVAVCNVFPNGSFSSDPSLGIFVDPSQIFVQLPDNAEQLEKGWQAMLAADETSIASSLASDTSVFMLATSTETYLPLAPTAMLPYR